MKYILYLQKIFKMFLKSIDIPLFLIVVVLVLLGLITNYPGDGFSFDTLFFKQLIFVGIFLLIILIGSRFSYNFLRGPMINVTFYLISILILISLLLFAPPLNGAKSWFIFGPISIQPIDFIKIAFIIVLARYFETRHAHIRHIRHIVVTLILTLILVFLTMKQPDLGSSVVLLGIWFGMILISGVSKKHLVGLFLSGIILSGLVWQLALNDIQKERVISFLNPLQNLQTSGYNTYQSKVAIGSGELIGKGIGEGTQSKLQFLPLYESDFVFAAFAEEWGFIGVVLLFATFIVLFIRLFIIAYRGRTNFETLFASGVISLIFTHFVLHVGVNAGVLPVTGITLPFLSYGGSHLVTEAILIAMVMSMHSSRYFIRSEELKIDRE